MGRVTNTEKYLNTLPTGHQQMMSQYRDHLTKVRYCIDENEKVIQRILQDVDKIFQNENQTVVRPENGRNVRVRQLDLDKVIFGCLLLNTVHWKNSFILGAGHIETVCSRLERRWRRRTNPMLQTDHRRSL